MTSQFSEVEFVKIGEAAKLVGKDPQTLRNWEKMGLISPERTSGGHRKYTIEQLQPFLPNGSSRITEPKVVAKPENPVTVNDLQNPVMFNSDFDDKSLISAKSQVKILEHTISNNQDREGILLLLLSMLLVIIIRLLYLLNISVQLTLMATELYQQFVEYQSTLEIKDNPDDRIVDDRPTTARDDLTKKKDTVWSRAREKAPEVYLALSKASVDQSLDEEERKRATQVVRDINTPYQRATKYLAEYEAGTVYHDVAALVLFHLPSDFGIHREDWSVRMLSKVCKTELGTKACSRSQVQRVLQNMKWNCRKTKSKLMSPDNNYGKIMQQLGLLMCDLKEGDLVLFGDEFLYSTVKVAEYKKKQRVPEGLDEALPYSEGKPFYRSIASIQIAGLVDPTTNRLVTRQMEHKNYEVFIKVVCSMIDQFLTTIHQNSTIHIVLDNASYHRPNILKKEINNLYGDRVQITFLPTYSPNHNPIERVWQFLLRNSLRCGENEEELALELQDAVGKFNETGVNSRPLKLHCEICGYKWEFNIGENQEENRRSLQKHICFQIEGINPFNIHVLKHSTEHLSPSSFAYPFT